MWQCWNLNMSLLTPNHTLLTSLCSHPPWDSPWPTDMTTTSLRGPSTLSLFFPWQGLSPPPPTHHSQTAQCPLTGMACDLVSLKPRILLIQLLQCFRFHCESHGDHPLCYGMNTEHPSSKWLLRQYTGTLEIHSPNDPHRNPATLEGLGKIC